MQPSARSSILASVIAAMLSLSPLAGCRSDAAPAHSPELEARSNTAAAASADSPTASPAAEGATPQRPAPSAVGTAATPNGKLPVLVCFGDSLTAGFGADPGSSYPDFLQKDLTAAGFRYRVVNQGISGNTTKDGLTRVDRVIALHPALVVVEFGGNDGLRGVPITESRANLDKILSTLKGAGTEFVLAGITLPPDYGPDYIHQFTDTYVLLAKKYHAPLLPFILQGAYGVDGMMQADGIHATARGNEVVARSVFHLVEPLLHI